MEMLEQHFDAAFAAPDGIKKLRELILSLAIQGKLVDQNSNDGPASELLKQIEAEKKRLVKEGNIKEPRPVAPIKPEEVPFPLPSGWKWIRIAEVAQLITSGSRDWAQYYSPSGAIFLTMGNLSRGSYRLRMDTIRYVSPPNDSEGARTRLEAGDLLISITGDVGNLGLIPADFGEAYINQHTCLLRVVTACRNRYWPELLRSRLAKTQFDAPQRGIKNSFRLDDVGEMIVPLPPLPMQERIVAKIDELMARCDALEKLRDEREVRRLAVHSAAVRKLLNVADAEDQDQAREFLSQHFDELYTVKGNVAELRKAILQLAVMGKLVPQDPSDPPASSLLKQIEAEKSRLVKEGRLKETKHSTPISEVDLPYALPPSWRWVRVSDIVEVGTGSTPSTANRDYYTGSIPWYTSSATNRAIAEVPEACISEDAIRDTNCKVFPAGSLIIALYGQGKTRGQISEIPVAGATNQAIAAMVFFDSSLQVKKYLKYFFEKIYEEIRAIAEGAAQPNLNVGKVKATLVPLPPLREQHRIVAQIDQLTYLCDSLEQHIDAAGKKNSALLNAMVAQIGRQ